MVYSPGDGEVAIRHVRQDEARYVAFDVLSLCAMHHPMRSEARCRDREEYAFEVCTLWAWRRSGAVSLM